MTLSTPDYGSARCVIGCVKALAVAYLVYISAALISTALRPQRLSDRIQVRAYTIRLTCHEQPFSISAHELMADTQRFSQKILNWGFGCALFLSFVCLGVSAGYLYVYLEGINDSINSTINVMLGTADSTRPTNQFIPEGVMYVALNARLVMGRLALQSCAVFVGLAFGFLGFALFLIGVKGEMDVEAKSEVYSVKVARMAPGVLVILSAAFLIGISVTRETPFTYSSSGASLPSSIAPGSLFDENLPELPPRPFFPDDTTNSGGRP